MSPLDLAIRGGTLVLPDGPRRADLAVEDERVTAVASELDSGAAAQEVDATGLHVLPGAIDAHVHFNEPGRAEWEGWATGTRALAAGGATLALDMPLNAHPPTIDSLGFDSKRRSAEGSALVDFGLWGGLVPGPLERLDELAERGAIGFKAFMCSSGIDDFPHVGDLELHEGMARAAALGLPVAVHAESESITSALAARALREGRRGVADFLASRPAIAELQAIARAIALAEDAGCALHVVHVSTGRGVAMVADARRRGT